jgi:hypothetical protein
MLASAFFPRGGVLLPAGLGNRKVYIAFSLFPHLSIMPPRHWRDWMYDLLALTEE